MGLKDSIELIERMHKTAMDQGLMRETPGAVTQATDRLTSNVLRKVGAGKGPINLLVAASIVEEELIEKLKKADE